MIRQDLAKAADIHRPGPRLRQRCLELFTDAVFRHFMIIALTTSAALVAKATEIVTLVTKHIAIAGDIDPVRPAAGIIFILISFYSAACTHTQVMVHQVM